MKSIHSSQHHACFPAPSRHRFVKIAGTSLVMIALWYSGRCVSPCSAASQSSGAALFQKHCSVCHTPALTVRSPEGILGLVRTPPPGMPAFGEDRLSDRDAQAIGAYLRSTAPGEPPAADAVPAPAAQDQASAGSGTERTSPAGRSAREKRQWIRSFGTPED